MKKWMAGLLSGLLCFTLSAAVFAAPVVVTDAKTQVVTVNGTLEEAAGETISLIVLNPGYTLDDIADDTAEAVNYTASGVCGADGKYRFSFVINSYTGDSDEPYTAVVAGGGAKDEQTFSHMSLREIADRLNQIDGASANADVLAQIEKHGRKFNLDMDAFGRLSNASKTAAAEAVNGKDLAAAEATAGEKQKIFIETFNEYLALGMFNDLKEAEEAKEFLTKSDYAKQLGLDMAADFGYKAKFTGKTEQFYYGVMAKAEAKDKAAAVAAVEDAELLGAVYDFTGDYLAPVLEKIKARIAVDDTAYQSLSSTQKTKVLNGVAGQQYDSLRAFAAAFTAKAKQVLAESGKNPDGGNKRPGGGGWTSSNTKDPVPTILPGDPAGDDPSGEDDVFSDLAGYGWAREAITALYNGKIIAGNGDGTFAPGGMVTRAEFVKMAVRAFKVDSREERVHFSDVADDAWYFAYVNAAAVNGIVNGYEGMFEPDRSVTREEMAAILCRTANYANLTLSGADRAVFTDDGEINKDLKDAVYALYNAGVINGMGDGTFAPQANATRAEAAQMIYGLLKTAQQ